MIDFQTSSFSLMTLGYKNPDVFQKVSWKAVAFSLLCVFLPVLPLSGSASTCGGTRISLDRGLQTSAPLLFAGEGVVNMHEMKK